MKTITNENEFFISSKKKKKKKNQNLMQFAFYVFLHLRQTSIVS